jgi:hypothetical protein
LKIASDATDRAQPHHGLLIIGIGAVVVSLFSFLPEGLFFAPPGRDDQDCRCMYQLFLEDVCQGTVGVNGPQSIEGIARAFGYKKSLGSDRKIPCGTAVKMWSDPPRYSTENIPGAYIIRFHQKIDINSADAQDLRGAPGIGPVTAERIVRRRQQHGPFTEVAELAAAGVMSKKKVRMLEPYLRAGTSRCDRLEHIQSLGGFVDPSIGGHEKELPRSHEIGKGNTGGY